MEKDFKEVRGTTVEKVYIFGHRKPDTDSVTSAVALSYLKNQLGMNTVPMVLGEVNDETKFVFNYFKVKIPAYLNDVKLQIKDVEYQKDFYLPTEVSIKDAYTFMSERGSTGVPLIDENRKFVNLITVKNIVHDLIDGNYSSLSTTYQNILNTLDGDEILKFDEEIEGTIKIASFRSTTFFNSVHLEKNDILIVGDRHSIIEYAIESGIKMIILVGNGEIHPQHIELAKKRHVNIIRTALDTFHTAKMIGLSNYAVTVAPEGQRYVFHENDYYDEFIDQSAKLKHNNYPVIGRNNICKGLLRITSITGIHKKKVILVDHNEFDQSVIGLDEAEIIEVVDHHNIGSISTNNPINFRNMSVGSTNTILYQMYRESRVEIPEHIAGLMISGILSDTLVLTSPTTTDIDRTAVEELAKIAKIDYHAYALEMFKAGTSLEGKTKEEIITTDIKSFPVEDLRFAVSQVFTLDFENIIAEKEAYIELINQMAKTNDFALVVLAITDIIRNGSYIFYTDGAKSILEGAFKVEDLSQGYYLDGCVSRKKQIVPGIIEKLK